ncbi:MAG TPA: glutamine--fructose-6-phosphate transaminase (isomerizing) [Burkholderiales bacterium]|jgi:glucosamine--fructose-6-phosphate aminotransferase (isomerizing)|nr:glutamine--fructose-6-phosphate transaminase (isomerizing) [Burkholderiales bacterium]
MCGIVGAVARRNVVPILLEGLRQLEYRGYDSAGLAVVNGGMHRLRSVGRVASLKEMAERSGMEGGLGIAHTRWATHGAPTERNAHPHVSEDGLAVVHNGIIENHEAIRERLKKAGYGFTSDTDTEVVAHLIHLNFKRGGDLLEAVREAVVELQGAYAIVVLSEKRPGSLIGARKGAPLLVGLGRGENFAASDASALLQVTRKIVYLEEGDVVELNLDGHRILDINGRAVAREVHESQLSADAVELGPYRHYMQKEIFEQPGAVASTLEMVTGAQSIVPELFGVEAQQAFARVRSVVVLACGTSYHAGLVARYWIESIAGLPCSVEIASEYRYRQSVPDPAALVITISQSGETADTIAALAHARALGHEITLAICNVAESSLIRQARLKFLTRAGPEIGVASTKAFTTQLAALFLLTLVLAKQRGRLEAQAERAHLNALRHLPAALQQVLALEPQVAIWAERFADKHHALFLGRGVHYPIAMEGALKLKEISYIHAEAYAAGELKHGPLALVDRDMPVVAIAPNDALLEKLKSNLQEVRARGGELYVFADADSHIQAGDGAHVIRMTEHAGALSPILHTVPLQLLAYHVALAKGTDVDKPRNLAKSVTVE